MKILKSLPFRLLLAIAIGIGVGQFLSKDAMTVVVTIKYILGQMINFCVPLIIIGFIAPSITQMGSGATRMLFVALLLAYLSSLLSSLLSAGAGYAIIPHLNIVSDTKALRELPEVAFQLDIPQIMPVMSALVVSVLLGLAAVWTKAKTNHVARVDTRIADQRTVMTITFTNSVPASRKQHIVGVEQISRIDILNSCPKVR